MYFDFNLGWLNVVGLVFDMIGAFILTKSLIISHEQAIELGVAKHSNPRSVDNINTPQVKDKIVQSRNAKIGLSILLCGFFLQIIGNWPQA